MRHLSHWFRVVLAFGLLLIGAVVSSPLWARLIQ